MDVKDMKPGSYQMVRFCMEPTNFEVRGWVALPYIDASGSQAWDD